MPFEVTQYAICSHFIAPNMYERVSMGAKDGHAAYRGSADGDNCVDHALGQQHVGVDNRHRQDEENEVNDNAYGYMALHHSIVSQWSFASEPRRGTLEDIACEEYKVSEIIEWEQSTTGVRDVKALAQKYKSSAMLKNCEDKDEMSRNASQRAV
ncbi:hypothetical protein VMCG_04267 [Cytospora schulzeri]|uniref:Uncharacterized protein n=1 Tax=Cytospora schulzeri TaxID=448051 RepID=A0A423WST6_9PEZI|nr:hypothetical protein VMCG_04267 [Valsa malicola]